jgi:hypothetical protein
MAARDAPRGFPRQFNWQQAAPANSKQRLAARPTTRIATKIPRRYAPRDDKRGLRR